MSNFKITRYTFTAKSKINFTKNKSRNTIKRKLTWNLNNYVKRKE